MINEVEEIIDEIKLLRIKEICVLSKNMRILFLINGNIQLKNCVRK